MNRKFYIIIAFIAFVLREVSAQIASGGAFSLEKSVVASGGGNSNGGAFAVAGTSGQTLAGTNSQEPPLIVQSGFWADDRLAPTAASVTIGGRVLTRGGGGIRNVVVTLTSPNGTTRAATTGSFGFYRFTDVEAGAVYILSVSSKRFVFANAAQVVVANEAAEDVNFTAEN